VARRLLLSRAIHHRPPRQPRVREPRPPRLSRSQERYLALKPFLDEVWRVALELGRWPDAEELGSGLDFPAECASTGAAIRLIEQHYDTSLLRAAALTRTDDLRVYFAACQFEKRKAFTQLEPRLRKDIKTFFGDYGAAQLMGLQLLQNTADRDQLLVACQKASEEGLGWLDGEHSLQLHIDLVERLPAVLRAYVSCGLILWDSLGEVTLVKIHIGSGKLSLLEFDEFEQSPLPALRKRVKINLRKLDYDVFEYGSSQYPKPLLFWKSRYMHEDQPGYAEQRCFDDDLEASGAVRAQAPSLAREELVRELALRRLMIKGHKLVRCNSIPDLDQPCGANFTYRSLIECGETQRQLGIRNLPLQPQTYNALHDLAFKVLDPLIEYFGTIKLTYGFCSAELGKHITSRVAHHLDQHAGHELGASRKLICSRGGAACDFLVADEDMGEVADWIIMNLPFDRLYFYGPSRPIHISYSSRVERKPYAMVPLADGRLMPRRYAK